jgi:4-amino-4-deoxy-L-arabinose transferase-like glycosyltransferase
MSQESEVRMKKFELPSSALVHLIILVVVSLPYFINLGKSSIWDANEAFYAETPREMMASGNYLAPQFNFKPRVQKPPLTYWIILLSYKLFGVNEFAVRLPGALAAIGTLLFSYGIARMLFTRRAALLSAIITATTPRVFILARRLPIDILLLFFLTGILFFLVRAVQKNERSYWILAYAFAAFGFLTKGPVAVVIPVCAYLLWGLFRRQIRIAGAHPFIGAAIFACIALPWYVAIYWVHGWTYISPFFLRDNWGRFAAETLGPSRGPFYYFSVYATDFFPWSIPALLAIIFLWLDRKRERPLMSLSFGLPVIWCVLVFILFSFSKNKQEYYIAPIYPIAAVLLSGFLDMLMAATGRENVKSAGQRSWRWLYGFLAAVLFSLSAVIPYALSSFMPNISPVLHYGPSLFLAGGFMLLLWSIFHKKPVWCFSALGVPLWIVYMMAAIIYLPAIESFRPVKSFCRIIASQSSGDDEAGFFGTALPSMVYYLRRPIFQESSRERMLQRFQSGKQVFCILDERDFRYFAKMKDLNLHILSRHSRFSVRFGALLNAGYFPEEELLLVSNRPNSEFSSGRSGPKL